MFSLTSRLLAEADSWLLPRKFKIAFSNTEADTELAAFQDVGFVATHKEGRPGFIVYLAGGLGAKPAPGQLVHDFLPAEEVYVAAEAVKRLFHRHGNRRNKHRNRLRFLWEDMGEQAFLEQYRFFWAEVRATNPAPLEWKSIAPEPSGALPTPVRDESGEFERWKRRYVLPHRRPGFRQVLFPVPNGNLPADQAIVLADFLEPFGPDVLRGTRLCDFFCYKDRPSRFSLPKAEKSVCFQRPEYCGEVAERLKAAVSKTVVGATSPGVRIPPSPF